MINHLHMLVLVSTFDFNWPRQIFSFFNYEQRNYRPPQELFSLECLLEHFVHRQFPSYLLYTMAYFLAPLSSILALLLYWRLRARKGVLCRKLRLSFFILLFTLHPFITWEVLQIFK